MPVDLRSTAFACVAALLNFEGAPPYRSAGALAGYSYVGISDHSVALHDLKRLNLEAVLCVT